MKHNHKLLLVMTLVLVLALIEILSTEPPSENSFITKLPERVFLPAHDSEEEFRSERYAEDGFTRLEATREYRDGVTETVKFRPNGTVSGYTQLHAGEEGKRQLKSHAAFDESGRFFVSHEVYRPDGTLERTGRLLADGRYESKYFWQDGKTIARHRFFDSKRKLVSEAVFSQSGARIATREKRKDTEHLTLYHENGSISSSSVRSMFAEEGKVYADDGTLLFEFVQDSWTTREDHYDKDGGLIQGRHFIKMTGTTDIYMFNTDGTVKFQQVWRHSRRTPVSPIEPILSTIKEGKGRSLYRTIEMGKDGKPTSVEYPVSGGGKIVKDLIDGKSVTRQKTFDKEGNLVSEVKNTGEIEKFDQSMLVDPPHAEHPRYSDEDAPPMVYDYK